MEIRPATDAEIDDVLNVMALANHKENDKEWAEKKRQPMSNRPSAYHVAIEDTHIVGTLRIRRDRLWCGSGIIIKGDVGEVSVLPSQQGKGIGTQLMKHAVEFMRNNGFHLSRLGGLARFYSRFGYQPMPRRYIEFPIDRIVKAGASRLAFTQALLPGGTPGKVRRIEPRKDYPRLWDLQEQFNRHRTGEQVFARPRTIPETADDHTFVYECDGEVVGQLRYREFPEDFSAFEAAVTATSLVYEPGKKEAVEALIKHILRVAYDRELSRITAFIPFDPAIIDDLIQTGLTFNRVEHHGGVATNMMRVTNLKALFSAISDELASRLGHCDWTGRLAIAVADDEAILDIDESGVSVANDGPADVHCRIPERDFLHALLGYASPDELGIADRCDLGGKEALLLAALFQALKREAPKGKGS